MAKRLTAKVGEYQKDGKTKGRYVDIGVILSNSNGEYILLDPTVNLAGVMMKQRLMSGKGESVMVGIWSDDDQKPAQQSSSAAPTDDFDDDIPF